MTKHRSDIKLRIPISNDVAAREMFTVEMLVPAAMTMDEWDRMMAILDAMRPALVIDTTPIDTEELSRLQAEALGIAINTTGKPEAVLSPDEVERIRRNNEQIAQHVLQSWNDSWFHEIDGHRTLHYSGPTTINGTRIEGDEQAKVVTRFDTDAHVEREHSWTRAADGRSVGDPTGILYTCVHSSCGAQLWIRMTPK